MSEYVSVYNTIVSVSNFDGQVVNQVSFLWRCIFLLISHIVFDFSVFSPSSLDAFDLLVDIISNIINVSL